MTDFMKTFTEPTPDFLPPSLRCDNIKEAIDKLIRENHIACEQLTSQQLADAIRQAIACGEFIRLVLAATPPRQQIIYHPYAECERLKSRIAKLEAALTQNGIELPE